METVSISSVSTNEIHFKYNEKIVTFYGIWDDGFAVNVNETEWYPSQPASVEEKIKLMTNAYRHFHFSDYGLYFDIPFDWKGSPLYYVKNGVIKPRKMPCICSAMSDIDEFDSVADYQKFLRYIDELLKWKKIRYMYAGKDSHGRDVQMYQCAVCKNVWCLNQIDTDFFGSWNKM